MRIIVDNELKYRLGEILYMVSPSTWMQSRYLNQKYFISIFVFFLKIIQNI